MASANRAQERLLEMFTRFGKETTLASLDADQADTAKMVREKSLEIIPQGSFSVRDYMDHAGVSDRWYSYHVKLSRDEDRITLDATESDDQADGSLNFLARDGALAADADAEDRPAGRVDVPESLGQPELLEGGHR